MTVFHKFLRSVRASAAIEFALVAPVLFYLILGIIEFGMITFSSVVIESATNSAARYVRTGYNPGSGSLEDFVRAEIKSRAGALINSEAIFITTDLRSYADIAAEFDTCLATPAPPEGTCPVGAPFVDNYAPFGVFNGVDMTALDTGAPGSLIKLQALYRWEPLTFFQTLLQGNAEDGVIIIQSTNYFRNEPA